MTGSWGSDGLSLLVPLIVLLLFLHAVAGGAAAQQASVGNATPSTTGPPEPDTAAETITLTQELHLTPDDPGEISITQRFSLPAPVTNLTTRVPADATVVSTTGFEPTGEAAYEWDTRTPNPSVTYRLPVNETEDVTGPIAGAGNYTFVDPGPWALVELPETDFEWSYVGNRSVGWAQRTVVDGPGVAGDRIAFLGQHSIVTRSAHGQTFRLVVPDHATLAESPSAILDSVSATAGALEVGDRDPQVLMIAVPTDSVSWAALGMQWGDSDLWVRDVERVDTPENVWVHEYVHTRQNYTTASETQWLVEGSATYYAALVTLEQDRIGFGAFRTGLAYGREGPTADAILAQPATWTDDAEYYKGALVAGHLDRRTRLATDRTASLQSVWALLNDHEGNVTQDDFRGMVQRVAGETVAADADRYTTTDVTPAPWDRAAHAEAFGYEPRTASPVEGEAPGFGVVTVVAAILLFLVSRVRWRR